MRLRFFHALLLFSWLSGLRVDAAPVVAGFDRFHASGSTKEELRLGGRLLFNELGCVNCHSKNTGLPERRGPRLAGIQTRLQPEWVGAFLLDPEKKKPGTSMPSVVPGASGAEVDAIQAYLASLSSEPLKTKPARHVNASRGRVFFHSAGCVACHAPEADYPVEGPSPAGGDASRSIPFPEFAEKYTLTSLTDFLKDPLRWRGDGRMPKVAMSEGEAVDVAGYLLGFSSSHGELAAPMGAWKKDPALVERGKDLVKNARCGACHELPADVAPQKVPMERFDGGCLAENPGVKVPHFRLSASQRASLRAYVEAAGSEGSPEGTVVSLTLQALNCVACHERDGHGGPEPARKAYFTGDHNLGDTGKYPPPLTAVGRKLRLEWMEKVLTGEHRVRPYLQTKMPVYGSATQGLAKALVKVDSREAKPLRGGDDTAGRKLLGTMGGLGCITCHRWGERPSLGIQALDISQIGQRLNPEWFREYLIDPAAYRPGTLMPSFWPGGKSANGEVLGGDTEAQIASIYSFAKSANGEPEGFPQTANGEFELVPKERPVVQRTFMEDVGTHAILVGFPSGTHLAFEGEHGWPVLAWSGKFFDAYNTWFSRFAPFEKVPGTLRSRWKRPADGNASLPRRFEGYRLDKNGSPIFEIRVGAGRVLDQFEGTEGGLLRRLVFEGIDPAEFGVTHPDGATVREESTGEARTRQFTYLWK
jgi:mono/diheme cytochrome c family protein